jgi:hypothetical protein
LLFDLIIGLVLIYKYFHEVNLMGLFQWLDLGLVIVFCFIFCRLRLCQLLRSNNSRNKKFLVFKILFIGLMCFVR